MTSSEFLVRFPLTAEMLGNESCSGIIRRAENKDIAKGMTVSKVFTRIETFIKTQDSSAFKKMSRVELTAMLQISFYFANADETRHKMVGINNAVDEQTWSEMK